MRKAIIFSAPSGAGKTTLVKHLMEQLPILAFSVSATSREKRAHEIHGKDYYFLSPEQFRAHIQSNDFLEWEEVYPDHYYGTLKSEVERILESGKAVIFDVDVIGGLNLKEYFGSEALAVFVKPPSEEVLENRLRFRNTETEEKIQLRLSKAKQELGFEGRFDTVIVNSDLEKAKLDSQEKVNNFIQNKP
jgi:guanylate kinase